MTVTTERPEAPAQRPILRVGGFGLIPALIAAAALVIVGPPVAAPQNRPVRTTLARAWPNAHHADIPGALPGGPLFQAALFTDANTVVGTAPTPDGTATRLLIRAPNGSLRQLRRLPTGDDPQFDQVTAVGDQLFWTESTAGRPWQIWTAPIHDAGTARRLTVDTGNATFYGTQYDLVAAGGRLYWTAEAAGTAGTEVRSVALTGGAVQVRTVAGVWALSAWPWLTDNADNSTGTTRLHNLDTGQEVDVSSRGTELLTCTPAWCRAMVLNSTGLDHIDLVHPDGTGRRRIAGGGARSAVADVAVLNRFEILSEPGPDSDLTGTATLLVYDISSGDTISLSAQTGSVFTHNGVLWWLTGGEETATTWHSLDLRTV